MYWAGQNSDIESWFRQLEAIFSIIEAPAIEHLRLASSLLRGEAFDRWELLRGRPNVMTYEDFKKEMIREFCPESIRVARDIAFMTTGYDPTILVLEIVRQFKRELLLSGHLVPLEETRIHLLAMRLPPPIVIQLVTQSHTDLQAY